MGKRKQVSVAVKTAIISLNKNSSLTQKEIGEQYGISQNTVSTTIKHHRETGSLEAIKRDGRPKTTTLRVVKMMKCDLKKNPFATAAEVKSALAPAIDGMALRTIRQCLQKNLGMRAKVPRRKSLITELARKKRLAWCRKYRHWTTEQ